MHKLIDFFFERKRFTIFLSLMFLLFGIYSYKNIAKEGAPQVKVPYVFVSVFAEGFSPKDSEKMILKPLEKELSKIQGIKNITTYAYVNNASAVIEFNAGTNNAIAMKEVREKTDTAKAEFPQEIKEPIISEIDLSAMPVLNVVLLAEDLDVIMPIARSLKDEIETISEILKVEIKGEKLESAEIRISPNVLKQFNISIENILQIKNNNKLISSGFIRSQSGEFSVNVPSLIKDFDEIKELPVNTGNGTVVKLKDIATIVKTHKDQTTIARINGKNALVLEISKRSGENIIKTIEKVRKVVDRYSKNVGDGVDIFYMRDTSQKIKDSLNNLQNNIILAIIIVFIMVMHLVGFRQALLIGLSVPISFFMAIWIFYLFGISLNIVVLFGLVLSVGMIVDASSVIVEYANQKISSGISPSKAYIESAHKMLIPVIISTITVLIVAAPLLAFPGIIGGFMKYLPLTLIIVLASSLFVALFLMPAIGALLDKHNPNQIEDNNLETKPMEEILQMQGMIGFYARMISKTIERPYRSLLILIGMIVIIIGCYIKFNKGVEFFPDIETNYIRGFVRGTGNISLKEKEIAMEKLAKKVKKEIANEIDIYYTVAGGTGGNAENIPKDAIGVLTIQLVDWQIRRPAKQIIKHLRDVVKGDGYIVNFEKEKDGPPQSTDIYYELFDNSIEKLEKVADEMNIVLAKKQFLENLEDTRAPTKMEYQIIINKPLAMKYGVDAFLLSNYIKIATNGVLVDKYSPEYLDEKSEIILRYHEEERNISQILNSFIVVGGKSIPIANFVQVVESKELVEIIRKNSKPTIAIKANIKEKYVDENGKNILVIKSAEKNKIFKELEKIAKKYDITLYAGGTDESQKETMAFLMNAFAIALIVIFLVFLVEFNSFGYASIIMSSVFLSIVGVLLGFLISQTPLGIVMCGIGIISLAGIVVSNNLIYLDFFQTLNIKDENSTKDALIRASILRVRPILLTSVTNVVGLIPAMFAVNIDFSTGVIDINSPTSQWWTQLSAAIAGGLTFTTILTLFFTPCKVLLYLKFKTFCKKLFKKSTKAEEV